jgi:hypothetical protein
LDLCDADPEHVCHCVQLAALECLPGGLKPGSEFFGITVAFHPHDLIMPLHGPTDATVCEPPRVVSWISSRCLRQSMTQGFGRPVGVAVKASALTW